MAARIGPTEQLVVAHFVPKFSVLTETFIYDQLGALERAGAVNEVLTLERQNHATRPFPRVRVVRPVPPWHPYRAARALGVSLGFVGTPRPIAQLPIYRPGLARALAEIRPSLVHAHYGPAGVMAVPVAETLGIPLVVSFYGYDISVLPRRLRWRRQYESLWRSASRVLVLSRQMSMRLATLGCPESKLALIHLGKDLTGYTFARRKPPLQRLISVGRLVEKKGHIDLLAAMHALSSEKTELSLTIVGDGPLRAELERESARLGLAGRVEFLGALPHDEVRSRMAGADAFVLCCKTATDGDEEGTPTVLMEAQALGMPCVTTRHAGIPDVIPQQNHWLLAQPGDVQSIASRLRELLSCEEEQIAQLTQLGRQHVEREFNVATEVGKLMEAYGRIARPVRSHA